MLILKLPKEIFMYKLYGIANCDTVKKAKKILEDKNIEFEFINFKKVFPTTAQIKNWKKAYGNEWPVNKKGRTYKILKDEFESLKASEVPQFISENTSLIKRPILERDKDVLCFGFEAEVFNSLN